MGLIMCQNCQGEMTLMVIPLGVRGKLLSSGIGRQLSAARVSSSSSETVVERGAGASGCVG